MKLSTNGLLNVCQAIHRQPLGLSVLMENLRDCSHMGIELLTAVGCHRYDRIETIPSRIFFLWLTVDVLPTYLLGQTIGEGKILSAGIPWFATLFGRDSLIAAMQTLMFTPP